jgi:1,6-anhydro-N-acetylmuramate kinase
VEGHGLAARCEVAADSSLTIPPAITQGFARLKTSRGLPTDAALLAAHLAESQAAFLDAFAAEIAPVWDRVLAVAVDDPGLWRHAGGLTAYAGLCDAARLAELSGQNVVDAFAARDLAQDGRGRPLLCIPNWMLLHDLQKTRALVQWGRQLRITYLPGSRDAAGAARVRFFDVESPDDLSRSRSALGAEAASDVAVRAIDCVMCALPKLPPVNEMIVDGPAELAAALARELARRACDVRVFDAWELGAGRWSLKPAGVALLGLLHLDQIPAGTTAITGARVPRVLGRLTPGSLANWHRLIRELAGARPSVVPLRSAV